MTDDLCNKCGIGMILPSGRCDHCNLGVNMSNPKTNRIKILSVDPSWLVELWNSANRVVRDGEPVLFVFPSREGIPADANVISVHNDWHTCRINVMLEHDSFPESPLGSVPEIIQANEMRCVELAVTEGRDQ